MELLRVVTLLTMFMCTLYLDPVLGLTESDCNNPASSCSPCFDKKGHEPLSTILRRILSISKARRSKRSNNDAIPKDPFYATPISRVYLQKGQTYHLPCEVRREGEEVSVLNWFKEDNYVARFTVVPGDTNYTVSSQFELSDTFDLIVHQIEEKDKGRYSCIIIPRRSSRSRRSSIDISVLDQLFPLVDDGSVPQSEMFELAVGQQHAIWCPASPPDEDIRRATLYWSLDSGKDNYTSIIGVRFSDGEVKVQNEYQDNYNITSNNSLIINSLEGNRSRYWCHLSSPGSQLLSGYVDVIGKDEGSIKVPLVQTTPVPGGKSDWIAGFLGSVTFIVIVIFVLICLMYRKRRRSQRMFVLNDLEKSSVDSPQTQVFSDPQDENKQESLISDKDTSVTADSFEGKLDNESSSLLPQNTEDKTARELDEKDTSVTADGREGSSLPDSSTRNKNTFYVLIDSSLGRILRRIPELQMSPTSARPKTKATSTPVRTGTKHQPPPAKTKSSFPKPTSLQSRYSKVKKVTPVSEVNTKGAKSSDDADQNPRPSQKEKGTKGEERDTKMTVQVHQVNQDNKAGGLDEQVSLDEIELTRRNDHENKTKKKGNDEGETSVKDKDTKQTEINDVQDKKASGSERTLQKKEGETSTGTEMASESTSRRTHGNKTMERIDYTHNDMFNEDTPCEGTVFVGTKQTEMKEVQDEKASDSSPKLPIENRKISTELESESINGKNQENKTMENTDEKDATSEETGLKTPPEQCVTENADSLNVSPGPTQGQAKQRKREDYPKDKKPVKKSNKSNRKEKVKSKPKGKVKPAMQRTSPDGGCPKTDDTSTKTSKTHKTVHRSDQTDLQQQLDDEGKKSCDTTTSPVTNSTDWSPTPVCGVDSVVVNTPQINTMPSAPVQPLVVNGSSPEGPSAVLGVSLPDSAPPVPELSSQEPFSTIPAPAVEEDILPFYHQRTPLVYALVYSIGNTPTESYRGPLPDVSQPPPCSVLSDNESVNVENSTGSEDAEMAEVAEPQGCDTTTSPVTNSTDWSPTPVCGVDSVVVNTPQINTMPSAPVQPLVVNGSSPEGPSAVLGVSLPDSAPPVPELSSQEPFATPPSPYFEENGSSSSYQHANSPKDGLDTNFNGNTFTAADGGLFSDISQPPGCSLLSDGESASRESSTGSKDVEMAELAELHDDEEMESEPDEPIDIRRKTKRPHQSQTQKLLKALNPHKQDDIHQKRHPKPQIV
ncbi:actin cytoskeleton-regulatory complex protein PAN1-like isoform X2 [Acanthaster planci]|uniref:Actin cytoskeleton-regulatory complex protein PAN1-like isoform X2 n=1 Tax=Acanthaster planci TaxID=133434 RepID=A0A8B7XSB0_ACAPL|nr:actin cytoskeleton-regulatory complex protein PAN1-like isoform X2 [Acanthaster planci]